MLSELQFWGVDKVDGASATLTGQIVCTDASRWDVQREFNRRLKLAFQAQGVEMSPPAATVVIRQQFSRAPGDEGAEAPRDGRLGGSNGAKDPRSS
jgi:small conductance mechanosensitive channel